MGPKNAESFQKDTHRQCCQENLELLTEDLEHFFQRLVTGDETWVYQRDPESKMESMQWKHKTSPTPKKAVMTWFAEQSKDVFFHGDEVVATNVGEVY
jgi:hypothetical protein